MKQVPLALAILFGIFAASMASAQGVCFCLRCLALTHHSYSAPASSMHPTLLQGTCFEGRYLRADEAPPGPGAVVAFRHPARDVAFVKRIVAVAGQTVQMVDGHLHIDGAPVDLRPVEVFDQPLTNGGSSQPRCVGPVGPEATSCPIPQFLETLPNGVSYHILDLQPGSTIDNTPEMTVPDGHIFVIGDNRDNSIDSRLAVSLGGMGMVPIDNILTVIDRPETTWTDGQE